MSIKPENYLLAAAYNDFSGASPLYRTLPSFNRFHSDPRRTYASLNSLTMNINLYSSETFSALPLRSSFVSSSHLKKKSNSSRLSDQLRRQENNRKKAKREFILLEEFVSPVAIEPESSSSQPSEPFSGSYRACSPNQVDKAHQRQENHENIFSEAFYARVNDFLDNERLDLVDIQDCDKTTYYFSKLREIKDDAEKDNRINIDTSSRKDVRSLTQSPRFISDNICCSTLFQRRASRSQGPGEGNGDDEAFKNYRPGKLNTFKHFKDDIGQLLMHASPIEEKDTPLMSRNNSGYQGNTPNGLNPRKLFLKHLLSPESMESKTPEEIKSLNNIMKSTPKCLKKLKSSLEIKSLQISVEPSPLKSLKEENISSSLGPSPTQELKLESIQNRDILHSKNGIMIRKSRFQKLNEF